MENYFKYFKGYKNTNKRILNPFYVLAIVIILILTIVFGLLGVFISLGRGMNFNEVFNKAPVLVIMTISALILVIPSLMIFIISKKNQKEMKDYKEIICYLDDNEEIKVFAKYENDTLTVKTWKTSIINKYDIKECIIEEKVKLIFTEEDNEYYILIKKEDFNLLNIDI